MQQRFTAIETHRFETCLFCITEQLARYRPWKLRPGHEISPVSASDAAEIAVSSNCNREVAWLRLNNRGKILRNTVAYQIKLYIGIDERPFHARMSSHPRAQIFSQ